LTSEKFYTSNASAVIIHYKGVNTKLLTFSTLYNSDKLIFTITENPGLFPYIETGTHLRKSPPNHRKLTSLVPRVHCFAFALDSPIPL